VRDGRLVCGYHGWSFDAQGAGRCLSQPSLRNCDTESFQVIERFGYLWLADRNVPEDALPVLGWDGFQLAGSLSHLFESPLRIALDNFSEDEHFPTVHSLLGWDAAGLPRVEFSAESYEDRTEVRYAGPQRRHPMLPVFGVKAGDRYHVFIFASVAPRSFLRAMLPLVCRAALFIGRREVAADAAIVRHVRTPDSLEGLRLTKFDKPLVHNRKLLDARYFGVPRTRPSAEREPSSSREELGPIVRDYPAH